MVYGKLGKVKKGRHFRLPFFCSPFLGVILLLGNHAIFTKHVGRRGDAGHIYIYIHTRCLAGTGSSKLFGGELDHETTLFQAFSATCPKANQHVKFSYNKPRRGGPISLSIWMRNPPFHVCSVECKSAILVSIK